MNIIKLLRKIIKEELGRDLESPRPDPLTWRDYPGINVNVTADPIGNRYVAKVEVDGHEDLSTWSHSFSSENDAMHWARVQAEKAFKTLMNSNGYTTNKRKFS